MYAIIDACGKQYKVQQGDIVFLEKLGIDEGEEVTFDKIIAIGADDEAKFGAPYISGATVTGRVLKNGKAKKVTVFTYRPKKDSRRKMGHRQPYTKVQIDTINA